MQCSQTVTVIVNPKDVQQYMGVLHIFLVETDEVYVTIPITADCQIAEVPPTHIFKKVVTWLETFL